MVRPVDGFSHRLSKLIGGERFTLLPTNVITRIFAFLHPIDILTKRPDTVCAIWYNEMNTFIWKRITKFLAPAIAVDKYDTETLKEYCLAKGRAFYGQKKATLSYIHLELQKEEYPPSYEYDPITTCENISFSENSEWKGTTYLLSGSGRYYDSFRSCEPLTYTLVEFQDVNGYYFNYHAPYYIYFTYDCKYEDEEEQSTSFTCVLNVFANDDDEDDDDFISPIEGYLGILAQLLAQKDSELDPNAEIFSSKYYLETRKRMEKLLSPEVIYDDDSEEVIHSKIYSLLFDWVDLVVGSMEKHSFLQGFEELRKDLRFISRDELDWNYFEELTEKFNCINICGEKTWFGFTLLDKRGERIPIFCRLSRQYESASREMSVIILGFFDSNDNLTGNLQEAIRIQEAQFYFEYAGFDSMSSFTGFDWINDNFSRYIKAKDELALFGSALEFYITMLKQRKFSKTKCFPRIKEDRTEYYFNSTIGMMLCFNSLHRGVSEWYSPSRFDTHLPGLIYHVQSFYSKHKKLLESNK
ncbi:predicted protein [Naegleria gruberi]|uniref:Predicted protein n=1 Tax=Naegleria gruberi TaxID=5762 RepID=D2V8M3_NAEGR|nr:uncharacterized protein NAEGRDRAFT_47552 [Naegleria gruberi]EFC46713.1 predicted protein [Naegleria gruberi]|eukprot:XP_002679457.1 predicted protein [Naegleria gruberi strain NEG-M]